MGFRRVGVWIGALLMVMAVRVGLGEVVDVAPDAREEYKGFPYPAGWPLLVPGGVVGTPAVADLHGDGKLSLVIVCAPMSERSPLKVLHPTPSAKYLVYAIDRKMNVEAGWPVEAEIRAGRAGSSSPSIFRKEGKDYVVMVMPNRKVGVITPEGKLTELPGKADTMSNVPLVDLCGCHEVDVVCGATAATVDGQAISGWRDPTFKNGYAPCIGDALGDGKMKVFHLFYTTSGTDTAELVGYDEKGVKLEGNWPRIIDDPSWHAPVMGDTTGDGKMEIVAAYGEHLFSWSWDGTPIEGSDTEGNLTGILKSRIYAATASPSLADLDGDGKAEIILFDQKMMALRAWRGDGKAFGEDVDGVIAKLPMKCQGVSVVNLRGGGDEKGAVDFFAGTYWVRRLADGKTTVTNMMPGEGVMGWTQPIVVDFYGDGKVEAIFGLSDGRVFIYKTGMEFAAGGKQWVTAQGDFQHTGCWRKP